MKTVSTEEREVINTWKKKIKEWMNKHELIDKRMSEEIKKKRMAVGITWL